MRQQLLFASADEPWTWVKGYLSGRQQTLLMEEAETYPYERPEVTVYGKAHRIPRTQIWFGDAGVEYQYSGLLVSPTPWPHYAQRLREQLRRDFGLMSNGVLVNRYAGGRDCMGWHADDEAELLPGSDIASVSLGDGRDFVVRHNRTGQKQTLHLESGDLLLMHFPMQQDWQHALPKRLRQQGTRWNFTFRCLIPGFHSCTV
ncbi:alpha-ketoglutarate-dependent dioxygenase AlkB family protein [Shewanella sp. GXUN23E]|uniref:alpha-ketoglutarate-dependent dioxygenase AlkB family protein n=1 Tax=Shewanella sp. GXUN23E TaxID=3422498 RepID=UPI003D7F0341